MDGTILYIKTPKNSTQKYLKLENKFSNVAAYKMSIQEPVAFLYAKYERSGKEIKKIIPCIIPSNTRGHDQGGEKSRHCTLRLP